MQHRQQNAQQHVATAMPALNADDKRVLAECKREAFLYRSLPYASCLCGTVYYSMKNGHLKKSPRFGYFPKLIGAAIFGMTIGRMSYANKCIQKFKNTGSPFSQFILQRGGQYAPVPESSQNLQTNIMHDDHDTLQEESVGLSDYKRLAEELSEYTEAADSSVKPPNYTTYNELRKSSRTEQDIHYRNRFNPPPVQSAPLGDESYSVPPAQPRAASSPSSSVQKNKYGDVWE